MGRLAKIQFVAAGTALLLLLPWQAAFATEPPAAAQQIEAEFEVYWLGLRVFSGRVQGKVGHGGYRAESFGETRGILDLFASANVHSIVTGNKGVNGLEPLAYRSDSNWNGRERVVGMAWRSDGGIEAERRPPPSLDEWDADRDEVPQAMRRGAIDPLTALFVTTTAQLSTQPCARTIPVFDGRRRYDIRLEYIGEETLESDASPVYGGAAIKCQVHFQQIAGFARKWNKEHPQPDDPTLIWLVRLEEAGIWLPVRAEGASSWGALSAVLTRHRLGNGENATWVPAEGPDEEIEIEELEQRR